MFWEVKTQSAKICLNFKFGGRVGVWKVKTQSAKICLNFNGGGGVLESQNPKLPEFQLGEGNPESQKPKCQDLPKFGGGGAFRKVKSKPKVPRSA